MTISKHNYIKGADNSKHRLNKNAPSQKSTNTPMDKIAQYLLPKQHWKIKMPEISAERRTIKHLNADNTTPQLGKTQSNKVF